MSEISADKIKELLSNPKSIELIASLAGNMGIGNIISGTNSDDSAKKSDESSLSDQDLKINNESSTINDNDGVLAVSNFPAGLTDGNKMFMDDKRITLLKAIKPYVNDSKKERLDGLVKAISVAGMLNNYAGGLFGKNK